MKKEYLFFCLVLISILALGCRLVQADNNSQIKKIDDKLLTEILCNSQLINANEIESKIEKNHILKVYKVPVKRDIQGTYLTAEYKIYLAISEYDEKPKQAVFYLGKYGDISNVKWLESTYDKNKKRYVSKIKVSVLNYSTNVFNYTSELKRKKEIFNLSITVDRIKIIE